jgi:hypothetical protein
MAAERVQWNAWLAVRAKVNKSLPLPVSSLIAFRSNYQIVSQQLPVLFIEQNRENQWREQIPH